MKTCPKCQGEMEAGRALIAGKGHFGVLSFSKKGQWYGDKIIPYYCTQCGYIEQYKEL